MPSVAGVAALVDEVARIVFGEMTSAARLRLHAVMTLYLHGKRSVGGGWFEDATLQPRYRPLPPTYGPLPRRGGEGGRENLENLGIWRI